MVTTSTLRAARQAPLPFENAILYENYPTTRIAYISPNENTPRKKRLPFAPDASDKERLIRVLVQYQHSCDNHTLNIHDKDRHTMASQVLCGDLSASWEMTIAAATNTDDADFVSNARAFLTKYMPSNAFHVQEQYMCEITKPFDNDCFHAASRLRLINNISIYLPGSGGSKLFQDETSLKCAFYRMMPTEWQMKFDETGNVLQDPNYDLNRIMQFMENLRLSSFQRYDYAIQGNVDFPCDDRYQPYPPRFQDGDGVHQYTGCNEYFEQDSCNQAVSHGYNNQTNAYIGSRDAQYVQSFDECSDYNHFDQYDHCDEYNQYDPYNNHDFSMGC